MHINFEICLHVQLFFKKNTIMIIRWWQSTDIWFKSSRNMFSAVKLWKNLKQSVFHMRAVKQSFVLCTGVSYSLVNPKTSPSWENVSCLLRVVCPVFRNFIKSLKMFFFSHSECILMNINSSSVEKLLSSVDQQTVFHKHNWSHWGWFLLCNASIC